MFQGIFTPSITPITEDGKIDFTGWGKHIDHLADAGIDGILIFGSIGEFYAFSQEEKREAIDFMAERLRGRIKFLVGTGGTNQDEVISLSRYAAQRGADAVVIISPYYFGPSDPAAERYFGSIASQLDLPILLYNFPARTGSDLSPELVAKLAAKYPNIVGIKDTIDTASHTRALVQAVREVRPDFSVLSGFDEYYLTNRLSGGSGILTGMTNVEPETFVHLHRAYEESDAAEVRRNAERVVNLMRIYGVADLFISAIKVGVKLKGLDISTAIKEPGIQADAKVERRVKEILDTPFPSSVELDSRAVSGE